MHCSSGSKFVLFINMLNIQRLPITWKYVNIFKHLFPKCYTKEDLKVIISGEKTSKHLNWSSKTDIYSLKIKRRIAESGWSALKLKVKKCKSLTCELFERGFLWIMQVTNMFPGWQSSSDIHDIYSYSCQRGQVFLSFSEGVPSSVNHLGN